MRDLPGAVEAALAAHFDRAVKIERRLSLGGGDISDVERIDTSAGRFVLKSHARPPAGLFRAEAAGLAALTASGTSLRVPGVIAVADAFLVLQDLGTGNRRDDFDDAFGRGLADVHKTTAPRFGFSCDTFCGTTLQPNAWSVSWIDFYGQARLGHQAELAARHSRLSAHDRHGVERLIRRLGDLLTEPPQGPSLIHGDLWSGNVHVAADGSPALIDPSVYFGHREAELGMMTLFGGFSSRVYAAYQECYPLEHGWQDRNPLYRLYHLMNHLNLFGGSYHARVMEIVKEYT